MRDNVDRAIGTKISLRCEFFVYRQARNGAEVLLIVEVQKISNSRAITMKYIYRDKLVVGVRSFDLCNTIFIETRARP